MYQYHLHLQLKNILPYLFRLLALAVNKISPSLLFILLKDLQITENMEFSNTKERFFFNVYNIIIRPQEMMSFRMMF